MKLLIIITSIFISCSVYAQKKPNIIFIMADDLGAECLQSYGGKTYQTPNLEKLAEEGMQFTNAYTTPVCTPTRVQLMTGQYPFRNGWEEGIWTFPENKQFLDPQVFNVGSMLKDAGYATAVAGKWQLAHFDEFPNHPIDIGFEEYCLWSWEYKNEIPSYIGVEKNNRLARYWNPGIWKNGQLLKDVREKYGPDIYNDFILDFMKKHKTEPFFIYYPMVLPHFPYPKVPGYENGSIEENHVYMIEYVDKLVGRIMQQTVVLGIDKNTIIIFTGDNGTNFKFTSVIEGDSIKGGKHTLTDAGTRIPFLIKWPQTIPSGKITDELIDHTDVLPTLAEITGAKIPTSHKVDGKSFLPLLKGANKSNREWVFCQLGKDWFLRTKHYRLYNDGKFQYLPDHYTPKEVDLRIDKEANRVNQELLKVANSLNTN